jgi:hypothetical protein
MQLHCIATLLQGILALYLATAILDKSVAVYKSFPSRRPPPPFSPSPFSPSFPTSTAAPPPPSPTASTNWHTSAPHIDIISHVHVDNFGPVRPEAGGELYSGCSLRVPGFAPPHENSMLSVLEDLKNLTMSHAPAYQPLTVPFGVGPPQAGFDLLTNEAYILAALMVLVVGSLGLLGSSFAADQREGSADSLKAVCCRQELIDRVMREDDTDPDNGVPTELQILGRSSRIFCILPEFAVPSASTVVPYRVNAQSTSLDDGYVADIICGHCFLLTDSDL